NRNTSQHGAFIRLPVGGMVPKGNSNGLFCVPCSASSTITVSPTTKNLYNSRCMSRNERHRALHTRRYVQLLLWSTYSFPRNVQVCPGVVARLETTPVKVTS